MLYTPSNLGQDEGNIVIKSNDNNEGIYDLPIVANSDAPCIQVSESVVEFTPAVAIGDVKTRNVTIKSCGGVPLVIESLSKVEGGSSEILYDEPTPLAGLELAPQETTYFEVLYAPLDTGVDIADLLA